MERERELVEIFEAAKKAADEAAGDSGGPAAVDRCVDALRRLKMFPVTMKLLVDTQVGKRIRYLKKHSQSKIQELASDIVDFWKTVVIEETTKNDKNRHSNDKTSVKVEVKSERTEIIKVQKSANSGTISRSQSVKVEKKEVSKYENGVAEKTNGYESMKVDKITRDEKSTSALKKPSTPELTPLKKPSIPVGPPKLTSMVKCNDPVRDKIRELLAEAFSRVSEESSQDGRDEVRNILDEVDACDPIRVAVMVESVMFEKLGKSNGAQKNKYRSIMFNLKDGKNPDFRRRVLLGQVKPEKLIDMTTEDMASDERKRANKEIKEKALFDCERGGPPKATTDQFKCGRCGQRKTTYYQLQTRSADEPMTTFVTCVNCNNHWKFC